MKSAINCYLIYIFDIHINCCFVEAEDEVEDGHTYDQVELGPLNMTRSDVLKRAKHLLIICSFELGDIFERCNTTISLYILGVYLKQTSF